MFFKNLVVFTLPSSWHMTAAELEEKLVVHPLLPCNQASRQSQGWVTPVAGGDLVHSSGKQLLIALGIQARLLPGHVVNREADLRAKELEKTQGFAPGRKQRRDLKDQVVTELLAKAFVRDKVVRAWIDVEQHRIVVDAVSPSVAEGLLTVLRNDLGELPAVHLAVKSTPAAVMQSWLLEANVPGGAFNLEQDCELVGQGQEAVRYVSHALDNAEIRAQVAQGKVCGKLGLLWRDRLRLVLTSALQIKRVVFEAVKPVSEGEKAANAKEDFEASFLLMTGEYRLLISDLVALFGGLNEEDGVVGEKVAEEPLEQAA